MNENKLRAAIAQNPVLVLLLGACPALAATTAVLPALTLGVTALAVMLLASLFSSLIKKLLPENTLFIAQFMLVAGFASMAQLLLNAWLPKVYNMLGVYAALLAVDALIFSESERAAQQSVGAALKDSFLTGLGFIAALFVTAAIREIFGAAALPGSRLTSSRRTASPCSQVPPAASSCLRSSWPLSAPSARRALPLSAALRTRSFRPVPKRRRRKRWTSKPFCLS